MYLEKMKTLIRKDTCTPIFIASLFTIAKTWKQPKHLSTDDCFKKMWYIFSTDDYSAIKKNEILPFAATWMDLEDITVHEVGQTKTNIYHLYVEPKNNTNESIYKTETDSQT